MQKVIIKEISPSTAENKPTYITDETGAKMSGFLTELKDLNPGDVIEAELQVKGKYTNIIEVKLLEKSTQSPDKSEKVMTTEMWSEKDRITRASIEGQVAMKCYTDLVVAKIDEIPVLLLDALIAKIRGFIGNGNTQAKKKAEPRKAEGEQELRQTFTNGVDLVNYALKQGWTMPEIKTKLTIEKPTDIIDVDEATKVLGDDKGVGMWQKK